MSYWRTKRIEFEVLTQSHEKCAMKMKVKYVIRKMMHA